MSTTKNKEFVKKIFDELAAGNHGALLKRVAVDAHWTVTGSSPVSGTYHGKKDFYEKVLYQVRSKLTNRVQPTVKNILAEGDTVVVEWVGKSTSKSGKPYNNDYCWVLKLKDGLIQEGTIYADMRLVTEVLTSG